MLGICLTVFLLSLAFIASLHSSENHGFLIRLEFVEVLGIRSLAILVSVSV